MVGPVVLAPLAMCPGVLHAGVLASPRRAPVSGTVLGMGGVLTGIGSWLAGLADAVVAAASHLTPVTAIAAVAAAVGVGAAGWLGRETLARRDRQRQAAGARLVTIMPPPEAELAGAQALWAHLMGLARPAWRRAVYGQPHLAWEYTWRGGVMRIACWIPAAVPPGLVEAAVTAAWPGATTHTVPAGQAPPPIPGAGSGPVMAGPMMAEAGVLRLADAEHFALRQDFDTDPLRPLIAAAADLTPEETACVQICARPAVGRRRLAASRHAARALRSHGAPTRATDLVTTAAPAAVAAVIPGMGSGGSGAGRAPVDPQTSPEIKDIVDKASQPRWEVTIRYAIATTPPPATDPDGAAPDGAGLDGEGLAGDRARLQARLRGRAHAVASAFAVFTGRNRLARRRLPHTRLDRLTGRDMGRGFLLSVGELAGLAHLPLDIAVPGLERAGARIVPAAPGLPTGGPEAKVIGDGVVPARPIGLRVVDARRHLHVLGPTGSGKTTLLLNLIGADIAAGRGTVVVDPGGDLVTDLLARLPARIGNRVVIIDPDSAWPAPALNPLTGRDPELAVDQLAGICRQTFAPFWGPRTDDVFRAAALTLLRAHPDTATLADVPRLLTDPHARARVLGGVDEAMLRDFWAWYDHLGEQNQAAIIAPLLNKMRAFLMRTFVRRTIAAPRPTFTMTDVLDHGGLLLARLPQGTLGEETARLLGSLLVAQVWQAITGRAATPPEQRRDASLYLDEFQHFLNLPSSAEQILAEARRFRLSLTLAHQNLTQLADQRSLKDAVAANARTKLWFAMAPRDAHDLEDHVAPYFTEHDLAHLGAHQIAARLVVDGADAPPCTVATRPAPAAIPGREKEIRAASATQFGRARHQRRHHTTTT